MIDREIIFEGINNCRDLGGLINKNGLKIKEKKLLRSAHLSMASHNDIETLEKEYKLSKIIDLRTTTEVSQNPDRYNSDVKYINNYIFDEPMLGISHENRENIEQEVDIATLNMSQTYIDLVKDSLYRKNFSRALRKIMEHDFEQGSILWHCTEGKDRCGLLSLFVLYVLDVDLDIIKEDYLLTNKTNQAKAEKFYQEYLIYGEDIANNVRDVFLAKEEYFDVAIKSIEQEFGGMDNYLYEIIGIKKELVNEFRKKVLEK